jgi:predicted transcriptional regulator of viral defense system
MALYTYSEALKECGSRSALMRKVSEGKLYLLRRNLYSTEPHIDELVQTMKLIPQGVVTGHTAFYLHGLTDHVPSRIDIATRRNATRISNPEIRQHFVASNLLEVGATVIDSEGEQIRIYDLEAMLFYLLHHEGKLPFDLFKEVMKSYRSRADELDYQKLQSYAAILPGGRRNLERMIKEVL